MTPQVFQRAVTTLPVRDLDSSIAFYTGVLDFRIIRRFEHIAYLEGSGTTIALRPAPLADHPSVHIGFLVRDLEEAQTILKRKGVTFIGDPVEASVTLVVFFNDPDGNSLYLFQWQDGLEKPC